MHLVIIGLNHKTAPVEVREKLAVSDGNLPGALESLRARECVAECCILSTCNRTEIYAVTNRHEDEEALIDFLSVYHNIDRMGFEGHIYRHRGHKAAEHLFCVACGIDSMMLGENQILSQVKNAFCVAGQCDSTKTVMNSLFQQALAAGKRARTETNISRGAFSIGYAAVELAKSIFGSLMGHTVLIIGAGKMGELTAKHLMNAGAASVIVANRTAAKAEELAAKLGGRAVHFDALSDALSSADVIISSTGSDKPIITRDRMAKTMHARHERPVFLIDIAVPRDVEPSVGDLENVFLYDIDDLQALVLDSAKERQKEIEKVKEIVAEETHKFSAWMRTLEAVPLIKMLREKLDELTEAEWERYGSKLGHLPEQEIQTVKAMMQSLANKICHNPLIKIKEYASSIDSYDKLEVARELFGLDSIGIEEPVSGQGCPETTEQVKDEEDDL